MRHRADAARYAVASSGTLERLERFDPRIISTILVGLDVPGSDIDVACSYGDAPDEFRAALDACLAAFGGAPVRTLPDALVGSFEHAGFEVEVYGAAAPVDEQYGWRHFRIMERVVGCDVPAFVDAVRRLRRTEGLKTEPALCRALGIAGNDPYRDLLAVEAWSDARLRDALVSRTGVAPSGGDGW